MAFELAPFFLFIIGVYVGSNDRCLLIAFTVLFFLDKYRLSINNKGKILLVVVV